MDTRSSYCTILHSFRYFFLICIGVYRLMVNIISFLSSTTCFCITLDTSEKNLEIPFGRVKLFWLPTMILDSRHIPFIISGKVQPDSGYMLC